jgi:CRP-like cAMP-binding protein
MSCLYRNLTLSFLFKGLDEEIILNLLKKISYKINTFSKNETIAIEGDTCNSIGIILKGEVEVQKIYPSGKTVSISRIRKGGIFGEVVIFSNINEYPSTIVSTDNTEIIFIAKPDIIKLCRTNSVILENFMELLSKKILILNNKLKNLSYNTIRQKISSFILDEYTKQRNLTIRIKYSRKELADQFGIPRPSLSRELIKMKNEELIDFDKNSITIKDLQGIEDCLFV